MEGFEGKGGRAEEKELADRWRGGSICCPERKTDQDKGSIHHDTILIHADIKLEARLSFHISAG